MTISPVAISATFTNAVSRPGSSMPLRSSERINIGATQVDASRNVYDPYEDQAPPSYHPPVDPRSWKTSVHVDASPMMRLAVDDVHAAVAKLDLMTLPTSRATHDEGRADLRLEFTNRPEVPKGLYPVELANGNWSVNIQVDDDLFVPAPLRDALDAARMAMQVAQRAAHTAA